MRRIRPVALLTSLLVLSVPLSTAAQRPYTDGDVQRGTLSFDGKATAGDFVGTTENVSGHMTGGPTIADVRGWVAAPVTTLKTGNDHRDRDLNKSMESAKYPEIRFDLSGVYAVQDASAPSASAPSASNSGDVELHGMMHIHGVDREVVLPGTIRREGDAIHLHSDFPLNVKDYQVGGLSKFLGMFKMNPNIVVHVDVTFARHAQ